ncbi:hypothetical protein VFPFJ_05670 [Purpureocillium lilacinum]|uniref:Uncharacterized protein n=1 Tax=Purpureocillium lilacinum TaxID=33203 RepID=A0A179HI67_PURLI|nr:hypothetical protein VFPFJ_05670 [Purpureocillium lilacinum]OAQ89261.1 hypothetical protein VFPFJ_05670 [Purpureocillium lilacinum]
MLFAAQSTVPTSQPVRLDLVDDPRSGGDLTRQNRDFFQLIAAQTARMVITDHGAVRGSKGGEGEGRFPRAASAGIEVNVASCFLVLPEAKLRPRATIAEAAFPCRLDGLMSDRRPARRRHNWESQSLWARRQLTDPAVILSRVPIILLTLHLADASLPWGESFSSSSRD